jgi:hypothetical protein
MNCPATLQWRPCARQMAHAGEHATVGYRRTSGRAIWYWWGAGARWTAVTSTGPADEIAVSAGGVTPAPGRGDPGDDPGDDPGPGARP